MKQAASFEAEPPRGHERIAIIVSRGARFRCVRHLGFWTATDMSTRETVACCRRLRDLRRVIARRTKLLALSTPSPRPFEHERGWTKLAQDLDAIPPMV